MLEFFGKKKKPEEKNIPSINNPNPNNVINNSPNINNPIINNPNTNEIHINLDNIEKQMDELMKQMMNNQAVQPGRPNFFSVSIKIDRNGNKTIRQSNEMPQQMQSQQTQGMKLAEPLADIHDLGNKISVIADLQGMDEKDVKINVENDYTVAIIANDGQRSFGKRFELPSTVDKSSLKTNFKNGILEITFNKKN